MSKRALVFAAVAEAATGLGLVLAPSLVGRLLLGADLTGVAVAVARVTGIALIALAFACWPGPPRVGPARDPGGAAGLDARAGRHDEDLE